MVSKAVISLRSAGRGRRIIAVATTISLLGAGSALIDYWLHDSGISGHTGNIVIVRSPLAPAQAAGHTALSPAANHLFTTHGKQDRADFDDGTRVNTASAEPRFVAASMTPLDMGADLRPRPAMFVQDVNRGGKADRLSLPQMAVAKLAAPVADEPAAERLAADEPADATGTSAALFFIAPPVQPAADSVAASAETDERAPSVIAAQQNALAASAKPGSQTSWSDLVKLASVGGGDGEKKETNIFGALSEKEFRAREFRCMATAVYFEARGESIKGQVAVGQVIMTRVRSDYYPNTICGVVFQGQWNKNACQFSFACDGSPDTPKNRQQWETALDVAKNVISGKAYVDEVGDATHYHATYVSPEWRKMVKRVAKVGVHIFYKAPFVQPLVASNDFKKL